VLSPTTLADWSQQQPEIGGACSWSTFEGLPLFNPVVGVVTDHAYFYFTR
jgi:hypothetical protein